MRVPDGLALVFSVVALVLGFMFVGYVIITYGARAHSAPDRCTAAGGTLVKTFDGNAVCIDNRVLLK